MAPARAAACSGVTFGSAFASSYTCGSLSGPSGVAGSLGGLTFLNDSTLLIGGNAGAANGTIEAIGVTRGTGGHITGFSGTAVQVSTAPYIDGGLAFGPGGNLFFTNSNGGVGEIKPGGTSPALTVSESSALASGGSLAFVPSGFAGAGGMKLLGFGNDASTSATLTADGSGTYGITTGASVSLNTGYGPYGPEGAAYVAGTNPGFAGQDSMLVTYYTSSSIDAYAIDANGNPLTASASPFLTSAYMYLEGTTIDPVTGDLLFAGGSSVPNQILVVSGFNAPAAVPAPSGLAVLALPLLGLLALSRRRR